MKSKMLLCFLSLFMAAAGASANERIYVRTGSTTYIVMPENIKMVDISTTKIAGNQCTDNIVRIKPSCGSDSIPEAGYRDNELLGTLTLIGERHIAQYDILIRSRPKWPLPSSRCLTAIRSPTSTRRSPCRWRKWRGMRGRSMAADGNTTRLCQERTA